MMRSMYSGVSGLRVHQTQMDVIGNNIANVNTVGYKSQRVTFSDMYYQTIQGASAPNPSTETGGTNPMQIGLGVTISSIDTSMTEGAAQRTDNPLDIKIEGDGFFVVGDSTGTYFTRAGVFGIDYDGNLVTPDGMLLKGWPVDSDGKIVQGQVDTLQIYAPDNAYSAPQKTTDVQVYGNIDKNDSRLSTAPGYFFTVTAYDELGYKYNLEFSLVSNGTAGEFDVQIGKIKDENGNQILDLSSGSGATGIGFDGTTNVSTTIGFDLTTGDIINGVSTAPAGTYSNQFTITGMDGYSDLAAMTNTLTVDLSGMTMYSGTMNVESKRGNTSGIGAGREAGTLSGFSVGQDGKITGKYTNGDTKTLGQIAIANFSNPAGLQKIGNNLFEATPNSGDFDGIGDDPTAIGSALTSGVLEMSNVDLSKEFTDMIVTQRGYQANSKIISVSDELLQELVNLVR